jgi:hypothetical protein
MDEPTTDVSKDATNHTPVVLCVQITHKRIRALSAAPTRKDRWNGRGWLQPHWTRPVHFPQSREESSETKKVRKHSGATQEEIGPVFSLGRRQQPNGGLVAAAAKDRAIALLMQSRTYRVDDVLGGNELGGSITIRLPTPLGDEMRLSTQFLHSNLHRSKSIQNFQRIGYDEIPAKSETKIASIQHFVEKRGLAPVSASRKIEFARTVDRFRGPCSTSSTALLRRMSGIVS